MFQKQTNKNDSQKIWNTYEYDKKKDISLQTQIEIWDLCMYVKNSNIRRRINIRVNKKVFKYVRMHVCVEILCGCV